MSQKRKSSKDKTKAIGLSLESKLSPTALIIISHVFIILAVIIFFAPAYFGGKTAQSGDITSIYAFKNFFKESPNALWNPYVFLGMPLFGNIGWADFFLNSLLKIIPKIYTLFTNEYASWTFYFLFLGFFNFYLMRHLRATIIVSIIVAVASMFSTGIVLLYFIGHITKLLSLVIFPLVILFLLRFNEKIKLLDVLLFVLTMHFLFSQWHVQIMFYIFFSVGVFYLYFFARSFKLKNKALTKTLVKSVTAFAFISVIALGMNYYKLKQIYDYTPYSTRGTKSIVDLQKKSPEKEQEDFYNYATNWSFSPEEMGTFLFPSLYGYGNSSYQGPLTKNREVSVNTYFGQMPFVDAAQYMGIVILLLGLFGIVTRWKEPLVRFLTILILVSLILSFGRTFPLLYNLFYDYFPFFNKFRAPVMILNIVQLSLPILAGLGLMKIFTIKNDNDLSGEIIIKRIAIVLSVLLGLSIVLNQAISGWFIDRIAASGQRGSQLSPLNNYMSDMFLSDVYFSLIFSAGVFWLAYIYIKGKITADLLGIFVLIIVVVDLWRIDYRGIDYGDESSIKQEFAMPAYLNAIKSEQNDGPYRILNLKQDGSLGSFNRNNNYYVHFLIEDFYGYSGIKPRTYQDLIDVIGPANPTLWRMLNVKYLILDKAVNLEGFTNIFTDQNNYVYKNNNVLPRAYFVDSVATSTPLDILNSIKNNSFDPKKVAYLENGNINVDKPEKSASITVKSYGDENIVLNANATGNNMLFLGDTYYPVDWIASIDGNEAKIYKLNHGFMGILVPNGNHIIQFSVKPASFYIGKYITLTCNVLIFIGLGFVFIRRRKEA
ncbi:MAG TPA: YfhO family protein [Ignavibacteriaceae bacterium]|nr:YfhO family protein [Ignavibacteriaceae bacterium]